jgi:hypothetical protein
MQLLTRLLCTRSVLVLLLCVMQEATLYFGAALGLDDVPGGDATGMFRYVVNHVLSATEVNLKESTVDTAS